MRLGWPARVVVIAYLTGLSLLVAWLVLVLGHSRGYLCAAALVALIGCLPFVRAGRYLLYGLGAAACLATLAIGLWPTDPGGAFCGSVFNRTSDKAEPILLAEEGFDPASYLAACEERRSRNTVLVGLGGIVTVALVGSSIGLSGTSSNRRGLRRRPQEASA